MQQRSPSAGTGRRTAGASARARRAAVTVAVALLVPVLAGGPAGAATPTVPDHFPGLGGPAPGVTSQACDREAQAPRITVTVNGVEIDHFPGLSGSATGPLGRCTR